MNRHALVIGAGLAGISVGFGLVQRGWRVTVIDLGNGPANGASGLPVGMLSPLHTRHPTPMSRLCELGLHATLTHLQRLLPEGQGWRSIDVRSFQVNNTHSGLELEHEEHGHLVSPSALVQAWLQACEGPQLTLMTGHTVSSVRPAVDAHQWCAVGQGNHVIAQADVAVVCNAFAATRLLPAHMTLGLTAVAGQITYGPADPRATSCRQPALRHKGVYAPNFQTNRTETIWSMGATYHRGVSSPTPDPRDDDANRASLAELATISPQAMSALTLFDKQAASGELRSWVGVRCASIDRLPICGSLPDAATMATLTDSSKRDNVATAPGLFGLLALGSRGLSLAPLLGEVLAAQIDGDTAMLLPPDLLRAIDPRRAPLQVMRQARRQQC